MNFKSNYMKDKLKKQTYWATVHKGYIDLESVSWKRSAAIDRIVKVFGNRYTWRQLKAFGRTCIKVCIVKAV